MQVTHTTRRIAAGAAALVSIGTLGVGAMSAAQANPVASSAPAVSAPATTHLAPARAARPGGKTYKSNRVVYLTFDDGPNRAYTPRVLALLKRYDAKATFFMIGNQAAANRDLVRRVRAEGHAIGNHTYTHPWLSKRPASVVASELRRTDAVVGRTTCMRPPGGFVNGTVRSVSARQGKKVVLWTVDPADWRRPGAGVIASRTLTTSRPGSIVLMHDGGGSRVQTVSALSNVLARLSAKGYRFETLPACR